VSKPVEKNRAKNGGEEEKFSELGLYFFSRSFLFFFFFFTHTYFPVASPYKIKRAFLQMFLEGYVDIQHTNVFTYYKPRFKKTQPQ